MKFFLNKQLFIVLFMVFPFFLAQSYAVNPPTTTATNTEILRVVNPPTVTPSVSISATRTTICAGMSVTFTATPTNGGLTPTYVWKKNGTPIGGATTNPYTISGLANRDVITCTMTSSLPDASPTTATSAGIPITVNALPTIEAVPNQTFCAGISSPPVPFSGTGATSYTWTNSNTATGLAANGTGDIASFMPTNSTGAAISSTVTVTPVDGSFAYITNSASNTVSVINTNTNTIVATIPVGTNPTGVSV